MINACRRRSPCPCLRRVAEGAAGLPGCILAGKRKVWRRGAPPEPGAERPGSPPAFVRRWDGSLRGVCFGKLLRAFRRACFLFLLLLLRRRSGRRGAGSAPAPVAPRSGRHRRPGGTGPAGAAARGWWGGCAWGGGRPPRAAPAPGSPRRGTGPAGGRAAARVTIRVPARPSFLRLKVHRAVPPRPSPYPRGGARQPPPPPGCRVGNGVIGGGLRVLSCPRFSPLLHVPGDCGRGRAGFGPGGDSPREVALPKRTNASSSRVSRNRRSRLWRSGGAGD